MSFCHCNCTLRLDIKRCCGTSQTRVITSCPLCKSRSGPNLGVQFLCFSSTYCYEYQVVGRIGLSKKCQTNHTVRPCNRRASCYGRPAHTFSVGRSVAKLVNPRRLNIVDHAIIAVAWSFSWLSASLAVATAAATAPPPAAAAMQVGQGEEAVYRMRYSLQAFSALGTL
jgi:hypothetical protein